MGILFYDRRKYGDPRGECQAEDNSDLNVLIVTTEGGHWDIRVIIYTRHQHVILQGLQPYYTKTALSTMSKALLAQS